MKSGDQIKVLLVKKFRVLKRLNEIDKDTSRDTFE